MQISIISNSKRHKILSKLLERDAHQVKNYQSVESLPENIDSQLVVLPIPTLNPDRSLNLQAETHSIDIDELMKRIGTNTTVIGCNFSYPTHKVIDINKYEPFCFLNAVPSAEGAILSAMQNSDITLFKSNCLVIGYGRIGKVLTDRLKSFGANVAVTARNPKDIYLANAMGLTNLRYDDLEENITNFNYIFQTIPHLILDKNILDRLNNESVVIELASKGAGTDLEYAKSINKKVIYAPAIPEKYSPVSAGKIFYYSVIDIIKEINN